MSRAPVLIVITRTVREQRIRAVKLTLLGAGEVLAFVLALWH